MGDFLENINSDVTVGATAIDHLPLPEDSLLGSMPFNPEQGQGHKENLLVRALLASPFLVIFAYAWRLSTPTLATSAGSPVNSAWYNTAFTPSSLTNTILGFGGERNRYVTCKT
jgi:hypothetical protein